MRISVELVPRGEAEVHADARLVQSVMPAANTFNIPDLVRFPLRSWDACAISKAILPASIPHIRAIDISPGQELPLANMLVAAGIAEVLVIQGDPPADLSRRTYPRSSAEIIRSLKRHHPALTVYAGFDPYRHSFRDEMAAVTQKIEAGADGFFTQPLFDVRLLEICAEMLRNLSVFWGIAPVLGERSRAYWETRNRVVFPSSFVPTLGWNRDFAISAVSAIRALNSNVFHAHQSRLGKISGRIDIDSAPCDRGRQSGNLRHPCGIRDGGSSHPVEGQNDQNLMLDVDSRPPSRSVKAQ